jgi:hypothetical protein
MSPQSLVNGKINVTKLFDAERDCGLDVWFRTDVSFDEYPAPFRASDFLDNRFTFEHI